MRTPVRGYAARRKWFGISPALITVAVLIVAFGGLWVSGVIDPLHYFFGPRPPSTRGLIPVPVSGMPIPAYTKLVRDHLVNPKTATLAVLYLRPEQVSPDMIRSMNGILGRVLNHDKPATYVFTESDFLPQGTRPGLVAGIPPGKRAMRVPVDKVPGLIGLLPGDRFDLVSTLAIDGSGAAGMGGSGIYGKQLEMQAKLNNLQKQATVRVVVQNGDVVEPMVTRQVPVANSSMTQGLIIRYKPVQEVVIAVLPGEVAHLTEALAVGAEISCVPRSGRPEDPHNSVTPESMPVSPYGGFVSRMNTSVPANLSPDNVALDPPITPSTHNSPLGANPYGAGFTPIETISGTKREIVPTPVRR